MSWPIPPTICSGSMIFFGPKTEDRYSMHFEERRCKYCKHIMRKDDVTCTYCGGNDK